MKLLPKLAALGSVVVATTALAADHADSPSLAADPSTDITDLYTWMDGNNVVLIMDVFPSATTASKFSNTALYTFHTTSASAYGMAGTSTDVICKFDATQKISCWVGGNKDYVTGDASATGGITSASGKVKVFAGLRDDPFFFNIDGFHDVVNTAQAAAPSLQFDAAGCPKIPATVSGQLVSDLSHTQNGSMPPVDHFANLNVLSIVMQVDKSLLTTGGPVVSAWASTNKAM